MIDLLTTFPALWVAIGAGATGYIAYLIARRAFSLSSVAQDRLVHTLERSNEVLTTERDDYRKRLHETRNTCQAVELKLKEAESRPDLTRLFETQQREADRRYEVYTQQTELIARQSEVLSSVAEMQKRLVVDLGKYEEDGIARHSAMMECFQLLMGKHRARRKVS